MSIYTVLRADLYTGHCEVYSFVECETLDVGVCIDVTELAGVQKEKRVKFETRQSVSSECYKYRRSAKPR